MKEPTSSYIISYNEINNSNLKSYFSEIMKKVQDASHVAIDLEFVGLTDKKPTDMNHRYAAMKEAVESGAIFSFGISIVKQIGENKGKKSKVPTLTSSISDLTCLNDDKLEVPSLTSSVSDLTNITDAKKAELLFTSTAPPLASVDTPGEIDFVAKRATTATTTTAPVVATVTATTATTSAPTLPTPKYEIDNFNIITLKQGKFRMDSETGTFLVEHGYSFDQLYKHGVPFIPPTLATGADNSNKEKMMLHKLWKHIMGSMRFNEVPMIVHHGLYDLLFIYHSFVGKLPDPYKGFLACLSEHFPSGIYDTRYLGEQCSFDALFLKYIFDKSDRMRQNRFDKSIAEEPYFEVEVKPPILKGFSPPPVNVVTGVKRKREEKVQKVNNKKKSPFKLNFCQAFSERGYCKDHDDKSSMHDVQVILDFQMGLSKYPQVYTSETDNIEGAHAAHFNAYMTGFSFCYFRNTLTSDVLKSSLNKISVSGIPHPIPIPKHKLLLDREVKEAQTDNNST